MSIWSGHFGAAAITSSGEWAGSQDILHFTRAAERLFVSQPALSKQIRMLERQLGAPLFDRGREGCG
jgi:hypothetical protein